jgi:hypothetical protein
MNRKERTCLTLHGELITPSATSSFAARVARERERGGASHQKSIVQNAHGRAHSIGARRANCKLAMRALRPRFGFFLHALRVLNF